MEKTQDRVQPAQQATGTARAGVPSPAATTWRNGLPVLTGSSGTLREVVPDDASALLAHLSTAEVTRFMPVMPGSVEGFERLIAEARHDREGGQGVTLGVVPNGHDHVVGLFQLKSLEAGFATAEWTFALGSAYWGSGLFLDGARTLLDFVFDTLGAIRIEARAVTLDGRGNGALRKIGAVQEGVLRRSFKRHGQRHDQLLWAVLAEDWRLQRRGRPRLVH